MYKHLNSSGINTWVTELKNDPGGKEQRRLLEEVLANDKNKFPLYMEECISSASDSNPKKAYEADGKLPPFVLDGKKIIPFMAGHMYLMPVEDMLALYNKWKDIPYEDAVLPSFWGAVTLSGIREGIIEPAWLAVGRGRMGQKECTDTIKGNLEFALKSEENEKIDRFFRRIIRWTMGPNIFRWNGAELYGNCSLAKAWWCGYLSTECAKIMEKDPLTVAEPLRSAWLELADYIAGRLSVISEPRIISSLALQVVEIEKQKTLTRTETKKIILSLGKLSSCTALGLTDPWQTQKRISTVEINSE